jgi:hypothetical protein
MGAAQQFRGQLTQTEMRLSVESSPRSSGRIQKLVRWEDLDLLALVFSDFFFSYYNFSEKTFSCSAPISFRIAGRGLPTYLFETLMTLGCAGQILLGMDHVICRQVQVCTTFQRQKSEQPPQHRSASRSYEIRVISF